MNYEEHYWVPNIRRYVSRSSLSADEIAELESLADEIENIRDIALELPAETFCHPMYDDAIKWANQHPEMGFDRKTYASERMSRPEIPEDLRYSNPPPLYCNTCEQWLPRERFNRTHPTQCSKCQSAAHNVYIARRPHRKWASGSICQHKLRGFVVNISLDDLEEMALAATHCAYCGKLLRWSVGDKGKGILHDSPTLERINNEKIICKENSTIVCHECNRFKGTMNLNDFKKRVGAMANNLAIISERMK